MSEVFDYTNRLGFLSMPPGYKLLGLDSGHFLWERESDKMDSVIHWDKWAIRRGAWADYHDQQASKQKRGEEE